MKDYFPLAKGLTLFYAYVDFNEAEPAVRRLKWKVEEVVEQGQAKKAVISTQWDAEAPKTHELKLDAQGVWNAAALEVKLPPQEGDEWTVEGDPYPMRRTLSLEAEAQAFDRTYEDCLEVGASNEDTDSCSRYYFPGIGLVREEWTGESRNSTLALVHCVIPRR